MYTYTSSHKKKTALEAAIHHSERCKKILDRCKPSEDEAREIRQCLERIKNIPVMQVLKYSREEMIISLIVVDQEEELEERIIPYHEAISIAQSSSDKIKNMVWKGHLTEIVIDDIRLIDRQPHLPDNHLKEMVSLQTMARIMGLKEGTLGSRLKTHYQNRTKKSGGRIFIPKDLQKELLNEKE